MTSQRVFKGQIVRLTGPSDAKDQAARLLFDTWHRAEGRSLDDTQAFLEKRCAPVSLPASYVAVRASRVLGLVSLLSGAERHTAILAGLAVWPDCQRQGIATALCRHAQSVAGDFGIDTFEVASLSGTGVFAHLGWKKHRSFTPDAGTVTVEEYCWSRVVAR